MFTAFLFAPSNLTFILNMVLLGVVLVVIAYALFSMLKKALPQAFHFVFFVLFIVVGLFFVKASINFIANYDLSSYQWSVSINGETIMITTPLNTISEALKVAVGNDETSIIYIALNNKDLNELIQSLSILIVGYFAFFIYMLDILLLAKPIGSLIYNLAFKWIFPKEIRKYKYKRRWKSFLIGLAKGSLAAVMFLTPFTSLVNSVNKGIQRNKTGVVLNQESYDDIIAWVDAYNDSAFAKLAFGVDEDGRSIDMVITDLATSSTYKDGELLFSDQLMTIADAAETLLAAGLLSGDGESGLQTSALLSKEFISAVIEVIKSSDFLMNLFPIVINIAVTYAEEMNFYTENLVFDDVDWKDELGTINNIYGALYDAGIISNLAEGNQFTIPYDDDKATAIRDAFKSLDESKFLSRVIPSVLYSFVTMEDEEGNPSDLSLYLSTDWDDYKSIKWGSELTIVYDTLYQLKKLDIDFFDNSGEQSPKMAVQEFKFVNGFFSNHFKNQASETEETSKETDDIIQKLMDNFDDVIVILTGLDKDKNIIEGREYKTLFDSNLLMNSIDKLLPELVDNLFSGESETTSLIDRAELESTLGKLQDENMEQEKTNYKKETYSLLNVCKDLLFNDKFDLMNNTDENILDNKYFQEALLKIAPEIDDSTLLSTCLPTVFESLLKDLNFGEEIPITGESLNFHVTFATEIPILLEGYNSMMNLASSLNSDNPGDIIKNLNTEDLEKALKAVYKSDIINPKDTNNKNFYAILDLIFDNQDFKDIGIYPDGKPNYESLIKNDEGWEREIGYIADVFANLKSESIIGLLTSSDTINLGSIESDDIRKLFSSIDNSKLLSGTFGQLMDKLVLDSLGIGGNESGISFTNVDSWAVEAEAFANALDAFKKIGDDMNHIDLLNSNTEDCKELLNNFASLQIFTNKDGEYVFGDFIHEIMLSSGDLAKYLENPTDWTNADKYSESKSDFKTAFADLDSSKEEIERIINVIDALQNIGEDGLASIMNGTATCNLRDVTTPLGEATSLRMIVFNIVDDMINDIDSPLKLGSIKDYLDTKFFINEENVELRKEELNRIADIYDSIMDLGDFSSIEWLDINPDEATKPLLINFASLKILKENSFGNLLHDLLTDGGALADYLKDPTGYSIESEYSLSKDDFKNAAWVDEVNNDYPEITKFVNVIKAIQNIGAGNAKPGTEGLNLIMQGNIGEDELGSVTGALCDAFSLRMVVFNVINDMINGSSSSFNLGEIDLSYLNTEYLIDCEQEERKAEVERVVKIFGDIKGLESDLSEINWIDMNTNDTRTLLTDFASLKMLSKGEEYYFDDLVHDLLIKGGSLADYLRDYGSTTTSPKYLTSKSDFKNAFTYDNSGNEIDKIINVIDSVQNIGKTIDSSSTQPGTLGLTRITSGNAKSSELSLVTEALCDASSLKMVVYNVINDTIKGDNSPLKLDGVNLEKAHTEYLLNCDVNSRKTEVNKVVSIYQIIESNESGEETTRSEAFNIYEIEVDELLNTIHDSRILNTLKNENYGVEFTIFEQLIEYMLSQKGLKQYITYGMPESTTVKDLVLRVANNHCEGSSGDEWTNSEITFLNNIVLASEPLKNSFSDTELINLSSHKFRNLMNSINESKLTHNAVYYFFKTTSDRMGINSFIRAANKNNVHYLLENVAADEVIAQCSKEIDYYADIIEMAKTGSVDEHGNTNTFDFENNSLESFISENESKSTSPLFNLLINSKIYEDVKSDIIYGIFNTAGLSEYIRGSNEDDKIDTINTLFGKGLSAEVEGASIDSILKQKGDIDFSKVSKLTDLDTKGSTAICNIIRNTKPEVNGNRSRAYFSSEVVAGMLSKATVDDSATINWYEEDYKYLVDDVADQINDILNAYSSSEKLDKNSDTFVADCTNFKASMKKLDDDITTKDPYILGEFKLAVFKDYNVGGAIEGMTFERIGDVIISAKSFDL